ncbi:MAG TPA: hypothetical protein VIS48_00405 [Candidatus Kryptonia bacterium]
MKKAMLSLIVILALSSISGNAQINSDLAQVTLQNNTQYDLCLYVDNKNNLVCGPASGNGGFCVSNVEPGSHVLIVATVDGTISASTDPVNLNQGDSKIVTATIGSDSQLKVSVN